MMEMGCMDMMKGDMMCMERACHLGLPMIKWQK